MVSFGTFLSFGGPPPWVVKLASPAPPEQVNCESTKPGHAHPMEGAREKVSQTVPDLQIRWLCPCKCVKRLKHCFWLPLLYYTAPPAFWFEKIHSIREQERKTKRNG